MLLLMVWRAADFGVNEKKSLSVPSTCIEDRPSDAKDHTVLSLARRLHTEYIVWQSGISFSLARRNEKKNGKYVSETLCDQYGGFFVQSHKQKRFFHTLSFDYIRLMSDVLCVFAT